VLLGVDEPDQIYSSRVHQILITAILQKISIFLVLGSDFFSEAQQQTQPDKLVAPPKSSSLGEDCQEFHHTATRFETQDLFEVAEWAIQVNPIMSRMQMRTFKIGGF